MGTSFLRRLRRGRKPKVDRRAAWRAFATRVGGRFLEGKKPSGDRILLAREEWTLELDTHVASDGQSNSTWTRVRVFFRGRSGLKLSVRRRHRGDAILRFFGGGGLEWGGRAFLKRYVVRGKPESRVRPALPPPLIEAMLAHDPARLEVGRARMKERRAHGTDARCVRVTASGLVTDADRLEGLVTVCRESISALERTGEATRLGGASGEEQPPG